MAIFISYPISTWDTHISPTAFGPWADMGVRLIWGMIWKLPYNYLCLSVPSCSKLTTSLVNDSLKFISSDMQICWNFLLKKCESAKATHILSAKNIRILYIESAKTVNERTLNKLVKLTMLWTTGPRCFDSWSTVTYNIPKYSQRNIWANSENRDLTTHHCFPVSQHQAVIWMKQTCSAFRI